MGILSTQNQFASDTAKSLGLSYVYLIREVYLFSVVLQLQSWSRRISQSFGFKGLCDDTLIFKQAKKIMEKKVITTQDWKEESSIHTKWLTDIMKM